MRRAALCSAVAALCLTPACHKMQPGDPLRGLTREQRHRFARGKEVFKRTFTPATGLGPLFNSTSCGECHENPKAGGRGDEVEVHATAFRRGVCDPLVQEGGFVIQEHATPALEKALGIDREPFPPSATGRGLRTTTEIFARGLLDLVPEEDILARADPEDRNHDGISGRPNRSLDGASAGSAARRSSPRSRSSTPARSSPRSASPTPRSRPRRASAGSRSLRGWIRCPTRRSTRPRST